MQTEKYIPIQFVFNVDETNFNKLSNLEKRSFLITKILTDLPNISITNDEVVSSINILYNKIKKMYLLLILLSNHSKK